MRLSATAEKSSEDSLALARVLASSTNPTLEPGTIINGHYKVVRSIASGSMGVVYLCHHTKLLDRPVAVKVLSTEISADPLACQRLAEEISSTYDVCHPNVIRTYEYFHDGAVCGFSMEYLDGGDLLSFSEKSGPLALPLTLNLLKQICGGVAAIHASGIVHRDIKPENILLTRDKRVKVSDFGIAYSRARSLRDLAGNVEGAIDYLSPEYVENGTFDERSDIFALGMVAFRLLAGRTPTEGTDIFEALQLRVSHDLPTVSAYRPDCPVFLVEFVRKCLRRDPRERFQTVNEMLAALNSNQSNLFEKPAKKVTPLIWGVNSVSNTKRKSVSAAKLSGGALVALLLAFGGFKLAAHELSDSREVIDPPVQAVMPVQQAAEMPTAAPIPSGLTHTVSFKGETLGVISLWYTDQMENWTLIAKANPEMRVDQIELGQKILIPTELVKKSQPLDEQGMKDILTAFRARKANIQRVEKLASPTP